MRLACESVVALEGLEKVEVTAGKLRARMPGVTKLRATMPLPARGRRGTCKRFGRLFRDFAIKAKRPVVQGGGRARFEALGHFASLLRHHGRVETMLHCKVRRFHDISHICDAAKDVMPQAPAAARSNSAMRGAIAVCEYWRSALAR